MKFLILSLALATVASAQQYNQQPIAIVRQANEASPDGAYNYNYETQNGISVSERGVLGPQNPEGQQAVAVQGQYQYTGEDGVPISVSYTADENGFRAQGAHIPVPPPIPAQIQRALEYIAAHPAKPEPQQQHHQQQHHQQQHHQQQHHQQQHHQQQQQQQFGRRF